MQWRTRRAISRTFMVSSPCFSNQEGAASRHPTACRDRNGERCSQRPTQLPSHDVSKPVSCNDHAKRVTPRTIYSLERTVVAFATVVVRYWRGVSSTCVSPHDTLSRATVARLTHEA